MSSAPCPLGGTREGDIVPLPQNPSCPSSWGITSLLPAHGPGKASVCSPLEARHPFGSVFCFSIRLGGLVPSGCPSWCCCGRDPCATATEELLGCRCHLNVRQVLYDCIFALHIHTVDFWYVDKFKRVTLFVAFRSVIMASLCVAALGIQSGFLILYPFSKSRHRSSFPPASHPLADKKKNDKACIYLGRGREFSVD